VLRLRVTANWTHVLEAGDEEIVWLARTLEVQLPPNEFWSFAGPQSERFYLWEHRAFPTGLLSLVVARAKEADVDLHMDWAPGAHILPATHDPARVRWPKRFKVRAYQATLVREAMAKGRGVIRAATSAGKTGMMAMLLRCLGDKPRGLVLVGSRALVRQTRDELSAWLREDVGEVAAGRRIVGPRVIVALVPSLAARVDKGWARHLLDNAQVLLLDECLHPDTLVACPEGERRIGDLRAGDLVLSPYRVGVPVKRVWRAWKHAVEYVTAGGRRIAASPRHLTLGWDRGGTLAVRPIAELQSLAIPAGGPGAPYRPDCIVSRTAYGDGPMELVDIELDSRDRLFVANGVVVHNCHHLRIVGKRGFSSRKQRIKSGQWYELAMACKAPNRYGMSATPLKLGDPVQNWRLVGATGPLFGSGISSTELIQHGYAARPYILFVSHNAPRLSRRVDYKTAVRMGIVECYERNEMIASATQDLFELGLKVLVLVEQVDHGKILHDTLRARGVACAFISGRMDQVLQEQRLDWLREPGPRVMVSTRVLGEGANVPDLGAVVYARGGKSYVQLFQGIGRGVRPKGAPGNAGVCIVIIPDDHHQRHLVRHVQQLRTYLASEPGYRVGVPGQSVRDFASAVLAGADVALEAKDCSS